MKLDLHEMELLEELRKKLNLVEAFWWFAENGTHGLCCPHAQGAQSKFELRDAQEVFDLMSLLHERKGANGGDSRGRGQEGS